MRLTPCRHCRSIDPSHRRRGLCELCYRIKFVRDMYPARQNRTAKCKNCHKVRQISGRGLCRSCHAIAPVKVRHVASSTGNRMKSRLGLKPCTPTAHMPGTPEYKEVLRMRVENDEELFHEDDSRRTS